MTVNEIVASNVLNKSKLPDADYVINPYIGCAHACIYCYARFMKRFTGHNEKWGTFVDVKTNSATLINDRSKKIRNKCVFMSSVTDPYQPIERKYNITRAILQRIITLEPQLSIQTKSALVIRDIDILRQFKSCQVGMTITTLDDRIRKQIEPFASSIESRLSALRKLKENGLITYIFIGPILPHLTNWKAIIAETKNYIDCFMFENLNMHGTISNDVYSWIDKYHPKLHNEYTTIRQRGMTYWDDIEQEIKQYCNSKGVSFKIYFDHKKYRKT